MSKEIQPMWVFEKLKKNILNLGIVLLSGMNKCKKSKKNLEYCKSLSLLWV